MSLSIPSPCLPYRRHLVFVPSPFRPRPVIISYRIPDDTATQSITCDTGYDDTFLLPLRSSPRPISSFLLASRPASRPASRRTVSPNGSARGTTPSYTLPASPSPYLLVHIVSISSAHPSSPLLACLVQRTPSPFISSISSAHLSVSLSTFNRMRRATSRRNGARDGQPTTGKRKAATSDASRIPQMPLPALRIAPTSRITHGYSHEHAHGKTTPPRALQRPRRDDAERLTRHAAPPPACFPTRR